jgi:hypothetical protein
VLGYHAACLLLHCVQSQLVQLPQILLAINQSTIAQMQLALSK